MKWIDVYEHPAFSLAVAFLAFCGIVGIIVHGEFQEEQEYRERLSACSAYNNDGCLTWNCKSILANEYDRFEDELLYEVRLNSCLTMAVMEGKNGN